MKQHSLDFSGKSYPADEDPELMEEIERLVRNPFYSGHKCPLRRHFGVLKDLALGVRRAISEVSPQRRIDLAEEMYQLSKNVVCDVCRCKAFWFAYYLAKSCDQEKATAIKESTKEINLPRQRSRTILKEEIQKLLFNKRVHKTNNQGSGYQPDFPI